MDSGRAESQQALALLRCVIDSQLQGGLIIVLYLCEQGLEALVVSHGPDCSNSAGPRGESVGRGGLLVGFVEQVQIHHRHRILVD